jgi:hypothetical protein
MTELKWKKVYTVLGELQAEIMRGLFDAQGITVRLSQEGVSRAYGLGIGPTAEVELLVPENQFAEAEEVLKRYQAGEFKDLGDQMDRTDPS